MMASIITFQSYGIWQREGSHLQVGQSNGVVSSTRTTTTSESILKYWKEETESNRKRKRTKMSGMLLERTKQTKKK